MRVLRISVLILLLVICKQAISSSPVVVDNIYGKLEIYNLYGAKMMRFNVNGATEVLLSYSADKSFIRMSSGDFHFTLKKIGSDLYEIKNIVTGTSTFSVIQPDQELDITLQEQLNQLAVYNYDGLANKAYNFISHEVSEKNMYQMKVFSSSESDDKLCEMSDCDAMDGVGLMGATIGTGLACAETLTLACGGAFAGFVAYLDMFNEQCGACVEEFMRDEPPSYEEIYPPMPAEPGFVEVCELFWPNCYTQPYEFPEEEECEFNCESDDPNDMFP